MFAFHAMFRCGQAFTPSRHTSGKLGAHSRRFAEWSCDRRSRSALLAFIEFNAGYVDVLKQWDMLVDGMNPIARTNVAPAVNPPAEPALYGFSYTVRSSAKRKTFVVAGAGELPEGSLDPHDVVRPGESSPAAIQEKMRFRHRTDGRQIERAQRELE